MIIRSQNKLAVLFHGLELMLTQLLRFYVNSVSHTLQKVKGKTTLNTNKQYDNSFN